MTHNLGIFSVTTLILWADYWKLMFLRAYCDGLKTLLLYCTVIMAGNDGSSFITEISWKSEGNEGGR